jgi:glutaconate CoA-transferase subunit A
MKPLLTPDEIAGELRSGMTIGIGGWGSRRKPWDLVKAIARSNLTDLTVISFGGPDVGLLCALGKVRKLVFGFVSLDTIPLEPHFRKAREQGRLAEVMELDEGMVVQGLRAAAWRLPFLPVRAGLGSDVMRVNPGLKTVASPYGDDVVVAMPPLHMDAALVHVHAADRDGNAQILGPDPYFDDLFCLAADRAYLSAEQLGLREGVDPTRCLIQGTMVTAVAHTPGGAGFTECLPDYPRDEAAMKRYADTARDPALFEAWKLAELGGAA